MFSTFDFELEIRCLELEILDRRFCVLPDLVSYKTGSFPKLVLALLLLLVLCLFAPLPVSLLLWLSVPLLVPLLYLLPVLLLCSWQLALVLGIAGAGQLAWTCLSVERTEETFISKVRILLNNVDSKCRIEINNMKTNVDSYKDRL